MSTLAASVHDHSVDISAQLLDAVTADYRHCEFAVRFWNGDVWGSTKHPSFTLVLKHPGALRRMLSGANELNLGEAYIYDDFDVEGNLEAAFEFGDYLVAHELGLSKKLRLAGLFLRLPHDGRYGDHLAPHLVGSPHSKPRDRQAVTYHYDLSNDFYSLWLDRQMVYSCAYFESGDEDIHSAQTKKLDHICRKLRLRPGERLLDVGCGWGALVLYAAKNFGVIARGVTLSEPQAEMARERIEEAGLSDRCEVQVCDYRDLEESPDYDKIVSVGMCEHVGESRLPEYFQKTWKLLRAGGVFLNHGIAVSATYRRKGPSFIDKYVFPDGGLVPSGHHRSNCRELRFRSPPCRKPSRTLRMHAAALGAAARGLLRRCQTHYWARPCIASGGSTWPAVRTPLPRAGSASTKCCSANRKRETQVRRISRC